MRLIFNKKIKAGALQYTLFVAVLIMILISTFLALTYLQIHFKTTSNFQIQSIRNADMGFDYISESEIRYEEEKTIELSSDISSHLILTKKHWGVFDILKVDSKIKDASFQKIGLIGGYQSEKMALYLKDNNKALVLVGNTKIQGRAFLPKKNVKRGNIAGHSYYEKELIYGAIYSSNKKLPVIKNREYIYNLAKGVYNQENVEFIELYEGLKKVNSFNNPTQFYKQQGEINLQNIQLIGNIIIQSDKLIKVENTALLNDIILIAPRIEIKDNVGGNFQAIATNSIEVGSNCNLSYPSALIVNEEEILVSEKNKNKELVQLIINSNSSIKGIVAYLSKKQKSNYKTQIYIGKNSIIKGEVYCDKNLEPKGSVHGSVYTSNFIARQYGSVYQNHIYNGSILLNKLPQQFVGLNTENSIQKVSKWLY